MIAETDIIVSHLPRIPAETWEEIFRKLSRPGDLHNVALTCRYINDIVKPILYSRIYLDQNPYLTYTLTLLKHDLNLAHRVQDLTLLPTILRDIPASLRTESETLYRALDVPDASTVQLYRFPPLAIPLGGFIPPEAPIEVEQWIRPIFHFFPSFTGLTSLHILNECVPNDFFHWIYQLPRLTTLEIEQSIVAMELEVVEPPAPLPLRKLSILKCWTRGDIAESVVPDRICDGLLKNAPLLTSLAVDLFIERTACIMLSGMTHPPPIQTFTCHGLGSGDPNCSLFCSTLLNLPTITTLSMQSTPRELGPFLPVKALPYLKTLAGQLKTVGCFFGMYRQVQYLTITDGPGVPSGSLPWEAQLISFFETLWKDDTDLKGLAFILHEWSDDVFLCVCHLWPGLKELKIRCTKSTVDEYFRISFGPRFLPQLRDLEVLHIYRSETEPIFWDRYTVKRLALDRYRLSPEEEEDLTEAPSHYRRWEKDHPSLREVAFYRHFWWHRLSSERGSWALVTEDLAQKCS